MTDEFDRDQLPEPDVATVVDNDESEGYDVVVPEDMRGDEDDA